MNIVLLEPEIPQNTGNIVRTCKSTDSTLHLIQPLGFHIDDKKLKRAGLDYWHDMDIRIYNNFDDFNLQNPTNRIWLFETYGETHYHQVKYKEDDYLVFGKETTGIPKKILDQFPAKILRIPMVKDNRSLNLSNTVAIVLYEALRQNGFRNMT